jgi:cytoskeletal protein CcmA (bactofilin family)
MSSFHHTPIVNGQPGDQTTFNAPLGQLDDKIQQILEGLIPFSALQIYGDVTIADQLSLGSLLMSGSGTVGGDLDVLGALAAYQLTLTTDAVVGGDVAVSDDVTVGGDLEVDGTTTLQNAFVEGDLEITGTLTMDSLTVDGAVDAGTYTRLGDFANVTIASGVVPAVHAFLVVDTEGAAATDELTSLTGGAMGQVVVLWIASNARRVTLVNGVGANAIQTLFNVNVLLSDTRQPVILVHNGTLWQQITVPNAQLLRTGPEDALTVSAGTITVTRSMVTLAGEGGLADDLVSINGGVVGQVLLLMATNVITLKHGTGNIYTNSGDDFVLSDATKLVALVHNGTGWAQVGGAGGVTVRELNETTGTSVSKLAFPVGALETAGTNERRVRLAVDTGKRASWGFQVTHVGMSAYGTTDTLTLTGTPSSTLDNERTLLTAINHAAATSGTAAAVITATVKVRREWEPKASFLTGLPFSLTASRWWCGLASVAITNSDFPSINMAAFRWSTVAGDTVLKTYTSDGVNNELKSTTYVPVADAFFMYDLEIEMDDTQVRFYIEGVLVTTHTRRPLGSLKPQIVNWTQAAAQNGFYYARITASHN